MHILAEDSNTKVIRTTAKELGDHTGLQPDCLIELTYWYVEIKLADWYAEKVLQPTQPPCRPVTSA